jgi:hypothetical protein
VCVKKATGKSGIAYVMRVEREYGKFLRLFVAMKEARNWGAAAAASPSGEWPRRTQNAGDAAQVGVFDLNTRARRHREGCEDWQVAAPTSNMPIGFEFGIRNASMFHGNPRKHVTILTHTREKLEPGNWNFTRAACQREHTATHHDPEENFQDHGCPRDVHPVHNVHSRPSP